MRNLKYILPLLLLASSVQAQKWEAFDMTEFQKLMNKANDFFAKPAVCVPMTHSLYTTYTGLVPYDKTEGFYRKSKERLHTSAMHVETIVTDKYTLTISHEEQSILFGYKQIGFTADEVSIAKQILKEKGVVEVDAASGKTRFRLKSKNPGNIAYYIIELNKDGSLKKLAMYFNEYVPVNPDDPNSKTDKPRIEVVFGKYDTACSIPESEFDISPYVVMTGKAIAKGTKFPKYELIDTRYNP